MGYRQITSSLAACFSCLLLIAFASGQNSKASNPDEPAIHDYILTMDKVQKYADVAQKGGAAAQSDAALAAEMKKVQDTDVSNLEKAAMMEKSPKIAAFLKSNNYTARDFVLTPMTVLTASMAVSAEDQKGKAPAFVNPANIKFVRDHRAELEKMNLMGGGDQ